MAKILVVDFDGVIHSYTSGWRGADRVDDPPVEGAIEFLLKAADFFDVNVFSSRSGMKDGIMAMQKAMQSWYVEHFAKERGVKPDEEILLGVLRGEAATFVVNTLKWPVIKPAAFLTLDDRALRFDGTWPAMTELTNFMTWQGR